MIATTTIHPTWHDAGPRIRATTRAELGWTVRASRAPRLRSLRQFAEDELVIPEGKYRGLKLRIHRQPYVGLLYNEMAPGRWRRTAIVGCVQAGKTFCGFVGPILWHLFEHRETVICGVPTMDVSADKWRDEILPAIRESRYESLLPKIGPGSRGGTGNLTAVKFRHGPTLKFMSGHGGDEKRSSFTSRVVVVTEADKMDEAGESSRETDPVSQLEARTASYDARERRMYLECTASIPTGRIWREYVAGTESRIACPCPHCGEYVTPEREHLHGWEDAATKLQAQRVAYFVCPACEKPIDDDQRNEMNQRAVLLHRGQSIDAAGRITGEPPETDTLGFRWNAFNNLFWSMGAIGAQHWSAARAENEDAAERELQQFYWAKPWTSPDFDDTPLSSAAVTHRVRRYPRGILPNSTTHFTVGVDLGKYHGHLVALAGLSDRNLHVPDYQVFDVPSSSLGVEQATLTALRTLRELIEEGWATEDGARRTPDRVVIDARYQMTSVFAFIRESGRRWLPALGHGVSQARRQFYNRPKKTGAVVKYIGEEYHVAWFPKDRVFVLESNADHWKSWTHQRLAVPIADGLGAMGFFHAMPREHTSIAKHITNERLVKEHVPGRGLVDRWVNEGRKPNHYFDALYLAGVGLHLAGFRLIDAAEPARPSAAPPSRRIGVQSPQQIMERMQ
jgi:phage terminase large subunit GpA-like protein